ncbi:MAG: ABC transporter permease, partial [Acidimicrobiia bacterium]
MLQYVVRRLVYGLITLLALSIITFTLLQNTGGDPLDRLKSNPRITQQAIQEMAEFYGLDQPGTKQYLTWAGNFVQFWKYPTAWGRSFQGPQQVQELVINRLGGTARLMFTALGLAVMIGIPLGI